MHVAAGCLGSVGLATETTCIYQEASAQFSSESGRLPLGCFCASAERRVAGDLVRASKGPLDKEARGNQTNAGVACLCYTALGSLVPSSLRRVIK